MQVAVVVQQLPFAELAELPELVDQVVVELVQEVKAAQVQQTLVAVAVDRNVPAECQIPAALVDQV